MQLFCRFNSVNLIRSSGPPQTHRYHHIAAKEEEGSAAREPLPKQPHHPSQARSTRRFVQGTSPSRGCRWRLPAGGQGQERVGFQEHSPAGAQ